MTRGIDDVITSLKTSNHTVQAVVDDHMFRVSDTCQTVTLINSRIPGRGTDDQQRVDRVRGDGAARVVEGPSGAVVRQSDQILLRHEQCYGGVFGRSVLQSRVSLLWCHHLRVLIDARLVSATPCVVLRAMFWRQSRALA